MGSAVFNELVTKLGIPTSVSFPYWIPKFSVVTYFPHSCPSACLYDIFTPDQMTDAAIDIWADISKMALTVPFALSYPRTGVCKLWSTGQSWPSACFHKVLLPHSHAISLMYCFWLFLCCSGTVEELWRKSVAWKPENVCFLALYRRSTNSCL